MRQHDALRPPGRARGVQEQCGLGWIRVHRGEIATVKQRLERIIHDDPRHIAMQQFSARRIAKHQAHIGILDDEVHRLCRQPVVHRHRHKARTHGAEEGDQILGAVRREDRHPVAAPQALTQQSARTRIAALLNVGVAERARRAAPQIDQRDRRWIDRGSNGAAQVHEQNSSVTPNVSAGRHHDAIRLLPHAIDLPRRQRVGSALQRAGPDASARPCTRRAHRPPARRRRIRAASASVVITSNRDSPTASEQPARAAPHRVLAEHACEQRPSADGSRAAITARATPIAPLA